MTASGRIHAGETLDVLSGPVCADGYNWYEVRTQYFYGWTAEAGDGEYLGGQYPVNLSAQVLGFKSMSAPLILRAELHPRVPQYSATRLLAYKHRPDLPKGSRERAGPLAPEAANYTLPARTKTLRQEHFNPPRGLPLTLHFFFAAYSLRFSPHWGAVVMACIKPPDFLTLRRSGHGLFTGRDAHALNTHTVFGAIS